MLDQSGFKRRCDGGEKYECGAVCKMFNLFNCLTTRLKVSVCDPRFLKVSRALVNIAF